MTSNRLFFKLLREDAKRRLWSIILLLLVYFFVFPVTGALSLNFNGKDGIELYTLREFCESWGASSGILFIITILAAVLLAISGFCYLHSARTLDFYHSQPIRRGMLFAVVYTDGILIFAVTFLIGILSALLVVIFSGAGYATVIFSANMFYGYFIMLLEFTVLYSLSVIAAELAGKTILSVFLTGILYGYPAVIAVLVQSMKEEFFDTYSYLSKGLGVFSVRFVSPFLQTIYNYTTLTYYNHGISSMCGSELQKYSPIRVEAMKQIDYYKAVLLAAKSGVGKLAVNPLRAADIFLMIGMIIVCAATAYILYQKRPSEGAGNAVAFEKVKPALKLLTAVPGGLGFGLFFREVGNTNGWLLFGLLCGTILFCCGIEAVFQSDIRAGIKKKKELAAGIGMVFIICIAFLFDWFHYNCYLPKKENLKSVSINFNFDTWAGECDMEFQNDWEYRSTSARYSDIEKVYPLLQYVTEPENGFRNAKFSEDSYWHSFYVSYHKQNGKTVYRRYMVDVADKEVLKLISNFYDDPTYRETFYKIYYPGFDDLVEGMELTGTDIIENQLVERQQALEFLKVYRKELSETGVTQLLWESPVYEVCFISEDNDDLAYYPVYTTCQESISWLKEHFDTQNKESVELLWICVIDEEENEQYYFNRWDDREIIEHLEEQIHYETTEYLGLQDTVTRHQFGIGNQSRKTKYAVQGIGIFNGMADHVKKPSKTDLYDISYYYSPKEEWSFSQDFIFYYFGYLPEEIE